jgi:hypothetical protein
MRFIGFKSSVSTEGIYWDPEKIICTAFIAQEELWNSLINTSQIIFIDSSLFVISWII